MATLRDLGAALAAVRDRGRGPAAASTQARRQPALAAVHPRLPVRRRRRAGSACRHAGSPDGHPVAPARIDLATRRAVAARARSRRAAAVLIDDWRRRFGRSADGRLGPAARQAARRADPRARSTAARRVPDRRRSTGSARSTTLPRVRRAVAGQLSAGMAAARAYEAERRRAEPLAELDRAKTAFFSNVSHEFRTPLTLMLGPLEDALPAEPAGAAQRRALELVHRNALRLLKLVNTLLDFSRPRRGGRGLSSSPSTSRRSPPSSPARSAMPPTRAGCELDVDCPPLPGQVYVDREMWERIVLNLLSNAFKFTLGGAIAVAARPCDGEAVLTVEDTGVGISPPEGSGCSSGSTECAARRAATRDRGSGSRWSESCRAARRRVITPAATWATAPYSSSRCRSGPRTCRPNRSDADSASRRRRSRRCSSRRRWAG